MPSWYACDPAACEAPDCACASTAPPGGLAPEDTPQFIVITVKPPACPGLTALGGDGFNILKYLQLCAKLSCQPSGGGLGASAEHPPGSAGVAQHLQGPAPTGATWCAYCVLVRSSICIQTCNTGQPALGGQHCEAGTLTCHAVPGLEPCLALLCEAPCSPASLQLTCSFYAHRPPLAPACALSCPALPCPAHPACPPVHCPLYGPALCSMMMPSQQTPMSACAPSLTSTPTAMAATCPPPFMCWRRGRAASWQRRSGRRTARWGGTGRGGAAQGRAGQGRAGSVAQCRAGPSALHRAAQRLHKSRLEYACEENFEVGTQVRAG